MRTAAWCTVECTGGGRARAAGIGSRRAGFISSTDRPLTKQSRGSPTDRTDRHPAAARRRGRRLCPCDRRGTGRTSARLGRGAGVVRPRRAEAERGNEREAVVHFLPAHASSPIRPASGTSPPSRCAAGDIFRTPEPPYDLDRHAPHVPAGGRRVRRVRALRRGPRPEYVVLKLRMRQGGELGLSATTRAELFLFWLIAGFGLPCSACW